MSDVINNTFRFLVYNMHSSSGIEIIFHEHNINNLYVYKYFYSVLIPTKNKQL